MIGFEGRINYVSILYFQNNRKICNYLVEHLFCSDKGMRLQKMSIIHQINMTIRLMFFCISFIYFLKL